ncbi:DUF6705 family protein [Flavobacterium sp.]|uniref:DUF6705 family protein n=1 Tax=Flavobacterium sp. TaxID=239 RepID=UPI0026139364|nr:DUF6705 family protein [Flavobacterium sp.]
MKKINFLLAIIFTFTYTNVKGQIYDSNSGYVLQDLPAGSYLQDIQNKINPFVGIWIWTDGDQTLTIKLEKVEHQYYPQYGSYKDYIIGDYSYTIDNGSTIVSNTINQSTNLYPDYHSMYASGPMEDNLLNMSFRDLANPDKPFQTVIFKFIDGTTNQLSLKIMNHTRGYLAGTPVPNTSFIIPKDIVLTKQ